MNQEKKQTENIKFLNDFLAFNNQVCEKIRNKCKDELDDMLSVVQEFILKIDTIFERYIYEEYIPFFELYIKYYQQCFNVSFHGIEWDLLLEVQEQFIECLKSICATKYRKCACCERNVLFEPLDNDEDCRCPICGISEKGRLAIEFLKKLNIIYAKKELRLLYIEPEKAVENWIIKNCPQIKYESTDLCIETKEEPYDFLLCLNILDDNANGKRTLESLIRILKPDGIGIFIDSTGKYSEKDFLKIWKSSKLYIHSLDKNFFSEKVFMENALADTSTLYVLCKTQEDTIQLLEKQRTKLILEDRENLPLVSVIVQVYNAEKTLVNTIDSILQQTYPHIELIIIDDASTDCSRKLISSYSDNRIKTIFLEKNHQVCATAHIAFNEVSGDYLALIGHDDMWTNDKIEKQITFMEANPKYGVCFTWAEIIDEHNQSANTDWKFLYDLFSENNTSRENWIRKLYYTNNHFCAPSACIRKHLLDEIGFYRYALLQLQDYDLWLRLLRKTSIYIIPERMTYYRRFSNGNKNISAVTSINRNRYNHEVQWILDDFIGSLSKEEFVTIFEEDMMNPLAESEKEILCEKAFLLFKINNCFALKRFIELFEDEECRRILSEKYQFEVQDFYKLNGEPMFFDFGKN